MTNITSLWESYPEGHTQMMFMYKFFFITQISYWLHTFPELYFQKVRSSPARTGNLCIGGDREKSVRRKRRCLFGAAVTGGSLSARRQIPRA